MKTAAAVVAVVALFSLFGKKHKNRVPPPPIPAPIVSPDIRTGYPYGYACQSPESVVVDETVKSKIIRFGKQLYRKPIVTEQVLSDVAYYIVVYAQANCIQPELAAALIARESGYNPRAVSRTGAKGLGQLIDSTAREMGVSDPFDIQQNLRGSIGYFKRMLDKWSGYSDQTDRAIASYLQGPGTVKRVGGVPSSARRYINDIYSYRDKISSM